MEAEVTELAFDRVSIFRPAVLMCDRQESRPGEAFMRAVLKPFSSTTSPSRLSIPTVTLAKGMLNNAVHESERKVELFNNGDIFKLANGTYYKQVPAAAAKVEQTE